MSLTKCRDHDCPSKYVCNRYISLPAPQQSYFIISPRDDLEYQCPFFVKANCCEVSQWQWGGADDRERHECLFCNKGWEAKGGEWVEVKGL